jgi:hypothetical protein
MTMEEYLSQSRLWKKFLEETSLSPKEALELAQDDGSYIGGEPHIYAPVFIKDEEKVKISYGNRTLKFSFIQWPYKNKKELVVEYGNEKEVVQIIDLPESSY